MDILCTSGEVVEEYVVTEVMETDYICVTIAVEYNGISS